MTSRFYYSFLVWIFICIQILPNAHAEPELRTENVNTYQAGMTAFQNKNYQEAFNQFNEFLKTSPDNAAALTNLGLTTYHLGQKPWAIAYFRKALNISPSYPPAKQGLEFVVSQLEVKEIPHQIQTFETIRELFLNPFSPYFYFWMAGILFFLFGWSLFSYLGLRKKAVEEETPFPGVPFLSIFAGVFCLCAFTLAGLKVYDQRIPRATIIENKVSAQSAPGENQLNLFDLYGGFEVIVRNHSGDWAQVTYPGAATGWIKKNSLYVTSGGTPW